MFLAKNFGGFREETRFLNAHFLNYSNKCLYTFAVLMIDGGRPINTKAKYGYPAKVSL
jgi:hypothetical protein